MCKRNSRDLKKKAQKKEEEKKKSTGCVREIPKVKEKRSQHGMCKRNFPDKNEDDTGCVRETSQIKMKAARDV